MGGEYDLTPVFRNGKRGRRSGRDEDQTFQAGKLSSAEQLGDLAAHRMANDHEPTQVQLAENAFDVVGERFQAVVHGRLVGPTSAAEIYRRAAVIGR